MNRSRQPRVSAPTWATRDLNSRPLKQLTLRELSNRTAQPALGTVTELQHVQSLGSYTWVENISTPTILVPGVPSQWAPRPLPRQLHEDSGTFPIDDNRFHQPLSPLESLFRCVQQCSPGFSFEGVDVVTDRTNLRNLFSVCAGKWDENEALRIDMEVLDIAARDVKTVLLERHDRVAMAKLVGWGRKFEEEFTTAGDGGADASGIQTGAHRRVLQYRFGDLNLVVRYEADAYLAAEPQSAAKSGINAVVTRTNTGENPRSLPPSHPSSILHPPPSQAIPYTSHPIAPQPCAHDSPLQMISQSRPYPIIHESRIVEIKTRSWTHRFDWSSVWPQLFFGDTHILALARHNRGWFVSCKLENVKETVQKHASEGRVHLKQLHILLKWMSGALDQVRTTQGERKRATIVYWKGCFSVYESSLGPALPESLLRDLKEVGARKRLYRMQTNDSGTSSKIQQAMKREE